MKYLLIALTFAIFSGCAAFEDEPIHNFYSYYGGYQVITGEPLHIKPLGWGGASNTEFNH